MVLPKSKGGNELKITVLIIKNKEIVFRSSVKSDKEIDDIFESALMEAHKRKATVGQFIEWLSYERGRK